jgi:hypothetical protein
VTGRPKPAGLRLARRVALALLVAAALLASAAAAAQAGTTSATASGTFLLDGKPTFPIVLSNPPPLGTKTPSGSDALTEFAAAGVSFLRVGPNGVAWTDAQLADVQSWDSAAAAHGLHTWVNLRELARAQPGTSGAAMLTKVVTTVAADSGLGLWKGADEPWWSHWTPDLLQYAYCLATSHGLPAWCQGTAPLDRSHLLVTVEAPRGLASDLAPYSPVTDTHGVDIYPVTYGTVNPDLHQVGTWTQTLDSITPDHQVWTTLQICASGSGTASAFVLPTRTQERYMIYDAIINGARALAFFGGHATNCWNASDTAHQWNWTFWNGVLKSLLLEIGSHGKLYPALLAPDAASDHALTASDATTEVLQRHVGSTTWVMAARSGTGKATVTIRGLPTGATKASVLGEGRSVTLHSGTLSDSFSQWGVHVYRIG